MNNIFHWTTAHRSGPARTWLDMQYISLLNLKRLKKQNLPFLGHPVSVFDHISVFWLLWTEAETESFFPNTESGQGTSNLSQLVLRAMLGNILLQISALL